MIFRVNHTKNYTVMSNAHLRDKSLSLKAKGLLSTMLSLPEDWDYSIDGLCKIHLESERAIRSALSELKEAGYLVVTKRYPNETESHRIEYEYDVYETRQGGRGEGVQNQGVQNQGVQNGGLAFNSILNTDNEILNSKDREDIEATPPKRFIPPTVEEVSAYCKEKGYDVDPERFVSFYASKGWKVGKNSMVDWKMAIVGWVKRDKERKAEAQPKHFNGERQYDDDFFKRLEERDK